MRWLGYGVMSLKKNKRIWLPGSLLAVVLIGCLLRSALNQENHTHLPRQIKIGFALATLQEERWKRDRDYLAERIVQLGGVLYVQTANNDQQVQLEQVEYLLSRKIDVLVILPQDLSKSVTAVQMAKRAGVKVISYDRLIHNADLDLYISFDNVRVGELVAESLIKKAPSGNYVIINGAPTDNNCYMLNQGYKMKLDEYLKKEQIKIIDEQWADDWLPGQAYRYLHSLLEKGAKFDAVIAGNDGLAGGVIEALAEWRLAGKVLVTGHDADLAACQRIVEGTQLMTVYKPIRKLAYRAAELAMQLAEGKEIKTNRDTIFNGKYDVQQEIIEPLSIDKDNMEIVIEDGFHQKEDIYMNVPFDE